MIKEAVYLKYTKNMVNEMYLKAMILIIKYSDFGCKDDLINILRNSEIKFGKIRFQKYEDIDLIVDNKYYSDALKFKDILETVAKKIYVKIHKYSFGNLNIIKIDSENSSSNVS